MKNIGVRYGVLGGLAVVFYFALLYFGRKEWFLHLGLQWASLLLYLVFMYRAAQEDFAAHGARRDFRVLVRTPFVVFLLINLAYWLFYYGIHLADPSLVVMELEQNAVELKGQIDAATDPVQRNELNQQLAELRRMQVAPVIPLGFVLAKMAGGALGGFALAAGITAWLRSRAFE